MSVDRPDTTFCFGEEQTDAIIKTAAYHCKVYDLSAIWFAPHEHDAIRASIATPFRETSDVGLGFLNRLPTELLHEVLFQIDIQCLLRFRQVNHRARQMVDALKQYKIVVTHGLNLLCAILRTQIAVDFTLTDMYDALCARECSQCNTFAGYMFLATWQRFCFNCLHSRSMCAMETLKDLKEIFTLTDAEIEELRIIRTLPDRFYGGKLMEIASVEQAKLISGREPRAKSPPKSSAADLHYLGSCALPYYDKATGQVDKGVSCSGCLLAVKKVSEFSETNKPEVRDALALIYGKDEFLEHFKWCNQAQLLWKSSDEGRIQPAKLPGEYCFD